jgi:hypothetical protein
VEEPKFFKIHGFEILPMQHSRHRLPDARLIVPTFRVSLVRVANETMDRSQRFN